VKGRHLLSIGDLTVDDLWRILNTAIQLKRDWREGRREPLLAGQTLGMIFEKPSLRTRVSFEVGMLQLGGRALYLSPAEVQMGQRESIADVARVLSRYVDCIMARVFRHNDLEELAAHAAVPVINGLSDVSHPCQALADMLTIYEKLGQLAGKRLAFVGDGDNNVAHSLLLAGAKLGMDVVVACPHGYAPNDVYFSLATRFAADGGGRIGVTGDPWEAVRGADIVYTDVWTSMGQEEESAKRRAAFEGYQVNEALVAAAKPDALVMHDLPAHRGEEITDAVLDGPHSVVFDQAENRMHAQKAALYLILGTSNE
jgi:ornithine carbamoyltransferase